jgi:hypothetical protein
MIRSTLTSVFTFSVAIFSGGCGAAHQKLVGQPVHQSVAILITTSDQVNAADDGGGVATLAEAVTDGLKENGIESQLYASKDDHPPAPRIELNVLYWHGTGAVSHKLAGAGLVVPVAGVAALATAGNKMVVDCAVFLPGRAEPAFSQRFEKWGLGLGWTATDGNAAANKVGEAIVGRILTR